MARLHQYKQRVAACAVSLPASSSATAARSDALDDVDVR